MAILKKIDGVVIKQMEKADGIPVAVGYVTEEKDFTPSPSGGQELIPTAAHGVSYYV